MFRLQRVHSIYFGADDTNYNVHEILNGIGKLRSEKCMKIDLSVSLELQYFLLQIDE